MNSNEFFKVAEHVSESEKPVFSSDYADSENKLYPCHTKEATLVNFAYFVDQASAYSKDKAAKIASNFQEKIAFWGLESAVEELINEVTHTDPVKFAMEVEGKKLYPYTDGKTLTKVAEAFVANKYKYPYQVRCKTAKHILKVANNLNAELPNDVVRYLKKAAGWAAADIGGMVSIVRNRAHDTGRHKVASALEEIASTLNYFDDNKAALFDTEKIGAFIEAIEAYDKDTQISSKYKSIGVPEERIYSDMDIEKVAAELKNTVKMTNGVEVEVTDDLLSKIATADPSLGKDIGGSISKAVDILPTLPRPDADYISETCL